MGVLTIELAILDAQSLKDKRRVIASLKQRLRNRFNISVAEVAHANAPRRCRLGVAMVSNESRALHSQLDRIIDMVRRTGGVSLLDYGREFL